MSRECAGSIIPASAAAAAGVFVAVSRTFCSSMHVFSLALPRIFLHLNAERKIQTENKTQKRPSFGFFVRSSTKPTE